ncbi:MAG: ABC transporter substrate-binding protein [Bacteroidales bacterium]|nr:MAG: ABC transporter substrate-binding protein [Bacteroidales bacterium]
MKSIIKDWRVYGIRVTISAIIFFALTGSCKKRTGPGANELDPEPSVQKLSLRYATGFNIDYYNDIKRITIMNPWQGARNVNLEYYLAPKGVDLENLPQHAQVIRIPVKRIICMSTTHIGMLDFIGKLNSLVGISGSRYVTNENVRSGIEKGDIVDIGYEQNIHYEEIISLRPDVIMTYGIGSEVAGYINKLKELGIPVVINGDYLEQSPLGKTEWVKFVAAFYNLENLAEDKFNEIAEEYNRIKLLAANTKSKPRIMTGLPWKDTWYIPGGRSFAVNLIRDAGGEYIWDESETHEAVPLDIEAVFRRARNADIWINPGAANKISDILAVDQRLAEFKPLISGNVFNNNKISNAGGGNDYWESGITNPHLILKDLVQIFHPKILQEDEMTYYRKIN